MLINPYRYAGFSHGAPILATTSLGGNSTVRTSGSFTPDPGELLIAFGTSRGTATPSLPTCIDSLGGSWTALGSGIYDTGSGARMMVWAYGLAIGGAPAAMTVQVGATNIGKCSVSVIRVPKAGPALGLITNYAASAAGSASGDPSVTLPNAPAATSLVLGVFVCASAITAAAPTDFTEFEASLTYGSDAVCHVVYNDLSVAQTNAWSTTGLQSTAMFIEIP